MHPALHGVGLLNMVSARTMAFRPLLVPLKDAGLRAGLAGESRAEEVEIILDGRNTGLLKRNQIISVRKRGLSFKATILTFCTHVHT